MKRANNTGFSDKPTFSRNTRVGRMDSTHGFAKKGYPRNTDIDERNIKEFIPYEDHSVNKKIADRYGQDAREDDERVNAQDPLKRKSKQRVIEEAGYKVYRDLSADKEQEEQKEKKEIESPFLKGEEYVCEVTKINDFGDATVRIQNTNETAIVYKGANRGLNIGDTKEMLFARKNKKGKYVFELPRDPEKLIKEYYNLIANDGMTEEVVVKKLLPTYGSKQIQERLKLIVDPKILEKVLRRYLLAA